MSHGAVESAKTNGAQAPDSPRAESVSPTPPPDGRWGWMVLFASFMIHVIIDGIQYSFGLFYGEFLTYFHDGYSYIAWVTSILVAVTLSSGPISSSFVNRWGCRSVTIVGALISATCMVASAFANNVLTLIFTVGVGTGFGFGLIHLPAIVSVNMWFERYRGLAIGIALSGSGLGTLIFAPITQALITECGWRGAMAIIGALILNCVPLALMFQPVPDLPRTPAREPMLSNSNNVPSKISQSTGYVFTANGKTGDGNIAKQSFTQLSLNKPQEQNIQKDSGHGNGTVKRLDVVYQGNMTSLAKFKAPSPEKGIRSAVKDREQGWGWLPCSSEFKDALSEMLDLSLLVDPIIILFSISIFLTSIGFYIPFVYIVSVSRNLEIKNSAYLISILGVSNVVGRIILGYISDKLNRLFVYNVCLIIAGISTALSMACWEFYGLAMYATVFGFTISAYMGLTSVVLVDLFGLEKLTNAFGLLLLFQGIASLVGLPFAGWLYDTLQSYAPIFYVAGATISLSGLILFFIPLIQRRMHRRKWDTDTVLEEKQDALRGNLHEYPLTVLNSPSTSSSGGDNYSNRVVYPYK